MKRFLLFLSFALALTLTVPGQTTSSSQAVPTKVVLSGTVYDTNGSVIALGDVLARSFAGKEYRATTNAEGIYKIELPLNRATTNAEGIYKIELPLDVYKIEVNAPGFCPKRVEMFRVRKSPLVQRPLDFVLEISEGDRPCKQKTMIKKEPKIRKPELFRSIAE